MAGKKDFKNLEKRLLRLGFSYSHTNSGAYFVYSHDQHPDIAVSTGIGDHAARNLLTKVERALGKQEKKPGRSGQAAKERQAKEREQQAAQLARLDAEREEIRRQRDGLLNGAAASLSGDELRALEDRVRQIEVERAAIERLMRAPTTGANAGIRSARHESGRRSA